MKKTMVYILSAVVLLSALSGCGRMGNVEEEIRPTAPPVVTMVPQIVTPDPQNGVVRDEDGIIEDDDTGRGAADPGRATPRATTQPDTGLTNGMNGTASPSPTPENGTN